MASVSSDEPSPKENEIKNDLENEDVLVAQNSVSTPHQSEVFHNVKVEESGRTTFENHLDEAASKSQAEVDVSSEQAENGGDSMVGVVISDNNTAGKVVTDATMVEKGVTLNNMGEVENQMKDVVTEDDMVKGVSQNNVGDDENQMKDKVAEDEIEARNNHYLKVHEKEIETLRTTLQDEYQTQVVKISDELRDHYQNDMDEKIAKLEEEWEQEFAKQRREFDEQVSAVQRAQSTQFQEAIERVTLDAEDQLKNMKYAYERETAEHKQRIKELLEREALWEMKEKELANEKCEKENESLNKIKKLEDQLSFEREEVESQLNGAQDEMKTLKKQHESEMESLTVELEKKYGDIVEAMRKELKSKYQEEMDRKVNQVESHLREQYDEDLEKTREEVQESTSTLKMKYEKQVADILAQLEDMHERNQQHQLREATLKENFASEKRKVRELVEELERKSQASEEKSEKDLKTCQEIEGKLKQALNEKFALEEKVKELSESEEKDSKALQEELVRKNEIIQELEQQKNDSSKREFEDLQEKLTIVSQEKECVEQKLNESYQSQKLTVEVLRKELEMKDEEMEKLREVKNFKEYKELEETVREISQEKQSLKAALESEKKQIQDLQHELQKKCTEMEALNDTMNDMKKEESREGKLQEMTLEKQKLEEQLENSKSELTLLQEKLQEDEKVVSDLKSNYDTKILQVTKSYEAEVRALESELKTNKNSEEEASKLKKDVSSLKDEVSKLNDEIHKHKGTISELEETSRARELEIANLILNSPSPQSLNEKQFDFSEKSSDSIQRLEYELAKYKKKVQELEEEAEDKFETTLCSNCSDREKSEEILLQTKALVEKIQLDCQKKVQSVSRDLEKIEKALREQLKENERLKEKLSKTEDDLFEERKRSLEISDLRKNVDLNDNVLGYHGTTQDISSEGGTSGVDLLDIGGVVKDNNEVKDDNVGLESNDSQAELTGSKDFKSLFEDQEKFYLTEISRKDEEISKLMTENEKNQKQVQSLKEELEKGEAHYEQLRQQSLEQKAKYEREINLMQSEINTVIEENNQDKDRLEIFQNNQKESERLESKLLEIEDELQEKSSKYELEMLTLKRRIQEKDICIADLRNALELLEHSRKENELNLENQKHAFSEREGKLLDEIREMTVAFENEKRKILEESLEGKEEMKKQMIDLELLQFGRNIDTSEDAAGVEEGPREFNGYGGVDLDRNAYEEATGDSVKYEEINYRPEDDFENRTTRRAWSLEEEGKHAIPSDLRVHSSTLEASIKTWNNENPRYPLIDHEESSGIIDRYSHLGVFERHEKYKEGLQARCKDDERIVEEDFDGFDDKDVDNLLNESPDEKCGSFSDDKYREIGGDDEEDLLKYGHDIDLLLERRENERLRAELETLTNCVDVFHDECELLKRSLDKTVHMMHNLQEERDGLVKEHDANIAEHSELMLDLVKYEEIISRLERGNERLEEDRRLLQECLLEKQVMLANAPTTKATIATQLGSDNDRFPREGFLRKTSKDFKKGELRGVNDSEYFMEKFSVPENRVVMFRTERPYDENLAHQQDFDTKTRSRVNETSLRRRDGVLEAERTVGKDFASCVPRLSGSRVGKSREESFKVRPRAIESFSRSGVEMFEAEPRLQGDLTWPRTISSGDSQGNERTSTREVTKMKVAKHKTTSKMKANIGEERALNHSNSTKYHFPSSLGNAEDPFLMSPSDLQTPVAFVPRKSVGEYMSLHSTSSTQLDPSSTRDERKNTRHMKTKLKYSFDGLPEQRQDHDNSRQTPSKIPSFSSQRRQKVSFTPAGRRSKRVDGNSRRLPRTPASNASTKSLNSSKFSGSSILTSTRANMTTPERLVPNLSGLSPIISPLDRRSHAEKLKWRMGKEERSGNARSSYTQDDTTFLINLDPYGTPRVERSRHSTRHTRSRSADDRLLTSSKGSSSKDGSEKPLVINFEDFVFRHRVKSSENVANLRDPSPAELWFS